MIRKEAQSDPDRVTLAAEKGCSFGSTDHPPEARGLARWPRLVSLNGALAFDAPLMQILWCRRYLIAFIMLILQAMTRLQNGTAMSGMRTVKV